MCDNCEALEALQNETGEDTTDEIARRVGIIVDAGGRLMIEKPHQVIAILEALKTQANSYPDTVGGDQALQARDELLSEGLNIKPKTMIGAQ